MEHPTGQKHLLRRKQNASAGEGLMGHRQLTGRRRKGEKSKETTHLQGSRRGAEPNIPWYDPATHRIDKTGEGKNLEKRERASDGKRAGGEVLCVPGLVGLFPYRTTEAEEGRRTMKRQNHLENVIPARRRGSCPKN